MSDVILTPVREDAALHPLQRRLLRCGDGTLVMVLPMPGSVGDGVPLSMVWSTDQGTSWSYQVLCPEREAFGPGYLDPRADLIAGVAIDPTDDTLWVAVPYLRLNSSFVPQAALIRVLAFPRVAGVWNPALGTFWQLQETAAATPAKHAAIIALPRSRAAVTWQETDAIGMHTFPAALIDLLDGSVGGGDATVPAASDGFASLAYTADGTLTHLFCRPTHPVLVQRKLFVRHATLGASLSLEWSSTAVLAEGAREPADSHRWSVSAVGNYVHVAWHGATGGHKLLHRVGWNGVWAAAETVPSSEQDWQGMSLAAMPHGYIGLVASSAGNVSVWMRPGAKAAWDEAPTQIWTEPGLTLTSPHSTSRTISEINIAALATGSGVDPSLLHEVHAVPVPEPEGQLIVGKFNRRGALYGV